MVCKAGLWGKNWKKVEEILLSARTPDEVFLSLLEMHSLGPDMLDHSLHF